MHLSSNLPVFLLASLILLLTPGPVVMYIVARSLERGRSAGWISVLGAEAGNAVLVLAASCGLSAVVLSSAAAFAVVQYLGAAYLIYLGLRRMLVREATDWAAADGASGHGRIFRQAFLVAVLNPKTAMFFLAFLPQFADPRAGPLPLQLLAFGGMFVLLAVVTDGTYALLAGTAGRRLQASGRFARLAKFTAGCLLIGLGAAAALGGIST
jgi:threonine/homoserine/homoserine lactone efflux protein